MAINTHDLANADKLLTAEEQKEAQSHRRTSDVDCVTSGYGNGDGNVVNVTSNDESEAANGDEFEFATKENGDNFGNGINDNNVHFDRQNAMEVNPHDSPNDVNSLVAREEEEEEESLQRKPSRRQTNGDVTTSVNSSGNVVDFTCSKELATGNGDECDSATEQSGWSLELNNIHNNSVYFDHQHGDESVNGLAEIKNGSFTSFTSETNCRGSDVHMKNHEIQTSQIEDLNDQPEESLNDRIFSDSRLTPSELCQEPDLKPESLNNEATIAEDFDILDEVADQEETDFDVENVLKKQNTHDLYCPNCNSCITRRVILCKRKPKIRNARRKPKQNKLDRAVSPAIASSSANSANAEVNDTVNIPSSDVTGPVTDDCNCDGGLEVFRCLSCFSFFIPTAEGFKTFWHFGNKSDNVNVPNLGRTPATNVENLENKNDNANVPNLGRAPATNKNWFFSIFAPNKKVTTVKQGKGNSTTTLPGIRDNDREPSEDASSRPIQTADDAHESLVPDLSRIDKMTNTGTEEIPIHDVQDSSMPGTSIHSKLFGGGQDASVGRLEPAKDMFASGKGIAALDKSRVGVGETNFDALGKKTGHDVILDVEPGLVDLGASQGAQIIDGSTESATLLQTRNQTNVSDRGGAGISVEILKSIVYGGLIECITSLGVVSSAAAAGSATLNILCLGLANVIGGLFVIFHNLIELKNHRPGGSSEMDEYKDRYRVTLGRRENFLLHATLVILSFLIFGMLPPITYGFAYRKSDDKDLKLAVVGTVSLLCIILLAIGKAHVQQKDLKHYISTMLSFAFMGIMASGVAYIAGDLFGKFVEKAGWFEPNAARAMTIPESKPFDEFGRASY